MDIPQRQQDLLQGIVLDENPGASFKRLDVSDIGFTDVRLPLRIEYDGVQVDRLR